MDPARSEFDAYAGAYDAALEKGISVSGENKEYFAGGRVDWLGGILRRMGVEPRSIMDYGCGTGSAVPFLRRCFPGAELTGVDISDRSLALARRQYGGDRARFLLFRDYHPAGEVDLVFCNGVFHHIPLDERPACVDYIRRTLKPRGLFALWENNPWNLGTQLVMARIPFDRDAIKIPPPGARQLLRAGGFAVLRTDFLFIFPAMLSFLRRLEPPFCRLPLGAQYMTLGRKPGSA